MHIGKLYFEEALTPSYLLNFMDENEIDKKFLKESKISKAVYDKITCKNTQKILK